MSTSLMSSRYIAHIPTACRVFGLSWSGLSLALRLYLGLRRWGLFWRAEEMGCSGF